MAETQKEYSRENIAKQAEKIKQAKEIQNKKKEIGYDKNTEDGRLKLSQEWIKRANLSGAQKQRIWKELGIITPSNVKEVDQKVKEWQEKQIKSGNKRIDKVDGILGWATLEALDTAIEENDKKWDKENNNTDKQGYEIAGNKEGYGLSRVGFHEKKNLENYIANQEKKDNPTEKKEEKIVSIKELSKHNFPWTLSDLATNQIIGKYPDTAPMGQDLRAALPEIKKILQDNPEMKDLKLNEYTLLKEDPYQFALEQAKKPEIDTNQFMKGAKKIPGKDNLGYIVQIDDDGKRRVTIGKVATNNFIEQENKRVFVDGEEKKAA